MNFNSWQYLVFFPVIFILYYAITEKKGRYSNRISQIMLLAASLFFYASWKAPYLVLIMISIIVTYLSGILMERQKDAVKAKTRKRLILAGSLVLNLAILFFFKYYNFFAGTLGRFSTAALPAFNILLPVGISFYTFQALGYSIDVYRGAVKAEYDFINYALFVTFFPQLVAGPIERSTNLLPQFKTNHKFDYAAVTSGLKLAAWGMFKKVVIADRLALYVNAVYQSPADYPGASLVLATVFFAFQIYCDFSGYSDIAIGCARALGFKLMTNFNTPYFASSIAHFWRRWHISLTTWLRDYIYIPLGGNRRGLARQCFNIIIVFAISGLWHGAAWHFVVWGALHGIYQVIERLLWKRPADRHGWMWTIITFILVCLTWVFFRAESIGDSVLIFKKFAALPAEIYQYITQLPQTGIVGAVRNMFQLGSDVSKPIIGFGATAFAASLLFLIILIGKDITQRPVLSKYRVINAPIPLRWSVYCTMLILIVMFFNNSHAEFIYFRF